MTLPAFLFGFLISTMYGAIFHLLKGWRARAIICLRLFQLGRFLGRAYHCFSFGLEYLEHWPAAFWPGNHWRIVLPGIWQLDQ